MKLKLSLIIILIGVFGFSQIDVKTKQIPLNISVINFDSIPLANTTIIVVNQTINNTQKIKTDSIGKAKILVTKGNQIKVKYKVLTELFEYDSFKVPNIDGYFELDYLMQYKIPEYITIRDLYFETDKSSIKQVSYSKLDELAESLTHYKELKLEIIGHTDNMGSEEYNLSLSQDRAQEVVNYLIKKGIEPIRLKPLGVGETQPIADNNSEEGRQLNRRTEIRIL